MPLSSRLYGMLLALADIAEGRLSSSLDYDGPMHEPIVCVRLIAYALAERDNLRRELQSEREAHAHTLSLLKLAGGMH